MPYSTSVNGFLLTLNLLCLTIWLYMGASTENSSIKAMVGRITKSTPKSPPETNQVAEFRNLVLLGIKHLMRAHRYARSSKTTFELEAAYHALIKTLEDANLKLVAEKLEYSDVERISPNDSSTKFLPGKEVEVCPEFFISATHGYPYYEKGFEMNCTGLKPKPFGSILTLALNLVDEVSRENLAKIAEDIQKTKSSHNNYSDLEIVIGAPSEHINSVKAIMGENALKFSFVQIEKTTKRGAALQTILKKVQTKYVVLLRDLLRLDEFSRLERLVRLLSYIEADYVGGSHRDAQGRWYSGCYQMAVRNYTMRVVEGYDLSYNSCMYCDYLTGPIAARTDLLRGEIDSELTGEQVYADLWIKSRDKKLILSCPDSMFHTEHSGFVQTKKSDWMAFNRKHQLHKLMLPTGSDFQYGCQELKLKPELQCPLRRGEAIPLCCYQELTDLVVYTAREFVAAGIGFELDAGSNVGAVKVGGTLPWERDHDFNLRVQNFSAAHKLKKKFAQAGYKQDYINKDKIMTHSINSENHVRSCKK